METESSPAKEAGILIIDPDKTTRSFFKATLSKEGKYEFWTAALEQDVEAVLGEASAKGLDLVMLDFSATNTEAPCILQKLLKDPRLGSAEILICSNELSDAELFLLREFNITSIMKKHLGAAQVLEKVSEVFRERTEISEERKQAKELEAAVRHRDVQKANAILEAPKVADYVRSQPEYFHLIGEVYLLNDKALDAINLLSDYLKDTSAAGKAETFRCLSTMGKALCYAKRYEEAVMIFKRLSEKSPQNFQHLLNRGESLLGQGNIKEAEAEFRKVAEQDPSNPEASVGIAKVRLAEGDVKTACSIFSSLSSNVESYSMASYFNNMGVALVRSGQVQQAVSLFEAALPLFVKHQNLILFNLGLSQLRLGRFMDASGCFDRILESGDTEILSRKKILKEYQTNGVAFLKNISENISGTPDKEEPPKQYEEFTKQFAR